MKKDNTTYKNDFAREKYDRFSLMLNKGDKEKYTELAKAEEKSLNDFIKTAIKFYIENHKADED